MYKDYYLKFKDEAEANSVLYRTEGAIEADKEMGIEAKEGYPVPNFMNISTIGVIYTGGEWDEEGNVVTEPDTVPGWHVNVRAMESEPMELIEPYSIEVNSPMRRWA